MSSTNFSYNKQSMPHGKEATIAIVVTEWNPDIVNELLNGAVSTLKEYGVAKDKIFVYYVPGTFELTFAAKQIVNNKIVDAVIVLGAVIQGETRHFDFICQGVTQGITTLNLSSSVPVIFGVLTTNNVLQARERAGGKLGNKGSEAAIAALKMIKFNNNFIKI